jgi:hypothetical protein
LCSIRFWFSFDQRSRSSATYIDCHRFNCAPKITQNRPLFIYIVLQKNIKMHSNIIVFLFFFFFLFYFLRRSERSRGDEPLCVLCKASERPTNTTTTTAAAAAATTKTTKTTKTIIFFVSTLLRLAVDRLMFVCLFCLFVCLFLFLFFAKCRRHKYSSSANERVARWWPDGESQTGPPSKSIFVW